MTLTTKYDSMMHMPVQGANECVASHDSWSVQAKTGQHVCPPEAHTAQRPLPIPPFIPCTLLVLH